MSDDADSSLGERLLEGVRNLWYTVNNHSKVLDHHGQEIESMKRQLDVFERQIHGLKSSKGRAIAKNARLAASLAEADEKICQIAATIN